MADNDPSPSDLLLAYADAVVRGEHERRVKQCADAYVKTRYRKPTSIIKGCTTADVATRLRLDDHCEYADLLDRRLSDPKRLRLDGHAEYADLLEHRLSDSKESLDKYTLYGRLYDGYDFVQHVGNKQMVSSNFLIKGELVRSTVAQVVDNIPWVPLKYQWHGSGFLVGENLFMTNNHVLPDKALAKRCRAHFDYVGELGARPNTAEVEARYHAFNPDNFWYTSKALDYTIVYVESDSVKGKSGRIPLGLFWNKLYRESPKALPSERVNIIQHPEGASQRLALRLNEIIERRGPHFLYQTATRRGSSGAPVMNDAWQLVGLHKAGRKSGNLGIRASVIAADLEEQQPYAQLGEKGHLAETCFTDPPVAHDRKKLLKAMALFEFMKVIAEANADGGEEAAAKAGEDWVTEIMEDLESMQKKHGREPARV